MNYLFNGKYIKRPKDLATRGIKSTYQTEKLPFNETFDRLWKLAK